MEGYVIRISYHDGSSDVFTKSTDHWHHSEEIRDHDNENDPLLARNDKINETSVLHHILEAFIQAVGGANPR